MIDERRDPGVAAEERIASLAISKTEDLDVEAIADDAGVSVKYKDLSGCEATLVGFLDRAIATVKPSPVAGRVRFSIAHELGHWDLHRGQSFVCRVDEPSANLATNRERERDADKYAAHLLMPRPIFNPRVKTFGLLGFGELRTIAGEFKTSLLATALRIVDVDTLPVVLACFGPHGRHWQLRSSSVGPWWRMVQSLDEDSFAWDTMRTGQEQSRARKQPAETWFTNEEAEQFEVLEHAAPYHDGNVLVLLHITAERMLISHSSRAR